ALAGAALLGAVVVADHGSGLPWALLLLLAASELLALRLAVAAVFALTTDGLAPIGTAILLALAFVERLLPGIVSKVLGARPHPNTVPTAVVSAVGLAAFAAATASAGSESSSAWLFAGTLAAAAVLLNQRWLFSAAVLAAALPIAAVVWPPSEWRALLPRAAWIALGAAAVAAMLRRERLQDGLRAICARFHSPLAGDVASAFWLGSAGVIAVTVVLGERQPVELWLPLLASGALLLFSPHRPEVAAAAVLSAVLVFACLPLPVAAAVLGGVGFTLCLAGALLEGRHRSALTWHHAGWALALVALGGGNSLHHPATAIAWGFAAGCAVVIAHRNPALEWVRWLGLGAAAHVGLFFLGLKLSTGAPRELILPWVASASLILGAIALRMAKASGRVKQRFSAAGALMGVGMFELSAGLMLLHGGETREAIVAGVGIAAALWALAGRISEDDDPISAGFAGVLLPLGFLAVRRLAFGAGPDVVETLAALVAGAGVGSLARWLDDGGLERSARVARSYAFWWPIAGLTAAPWNAPWTLCLLLLAQSAHFAVVARTGSARRTAAMLSTLAFNGAMAFAFFASGQGSAEYLLIPFGLSLLVLLKVFEGDLAEGTRVKLRAAAVTLVYSAAAFRPLTFESTNALWLCVGLCVVGVGLGIMLKVRSYVYLGTAFMITTIVANLVRYGVREPRMGALFLSGLGLAVVAFMVLVTTRRSELLSRYQRARSLLQDWEG
ncbi:MAG: putative rane protein, partial [Myxococcaceae bacterium]|nr:putative rane protein [Myxococcaceae bacterium]